jgi:hypothetical protein
MFQKKDGDVPESDAAAREERAYEDNWYRSLKALAEQRQDEDGGPEVGSDDPVHVATEDPVRARVEEAEPVRTEPDDAPPTTDRERLVSEEFETRAGQLLERLRSIQHLSEK